VDLIISGQNARPLLWAALTIGELRRKRGRSLFWCRAIVVPFCLVHCLLQRGCCKCFWRLAD